MSAVIIPKLVSLEIRDRSDKPARHAVSPLKIVAPAVDNLPWEDRPQNCTDLVWRYSANPVIGIRPFPTAQFVYNSAVTPWKGGFAGVFRADHKTRMPHLHVGFSVDGLNWEINHEPIRFTGGCKQQIEYTYDPRVTLIDGVYYIQWCNGYHGPTIGLARTVDFVHFEKMENAFLPHNRNGALFPRKINGHYAMLSRPSDTGHTRFGDIFYSASPDLEFWGRHRFVMGRGGNWWQDTKIGAGPSPLETSAGWLLFYHGVLNSCNGFVYSTGVALLDLDEPWKVLYRSAEHILTPEMPYETTGNVPNVVFPTAAVCDGATGRIALYCGAADTCTTLAFTNVHDLIPWLKAHSLKV